MESQSIADNDLRPLYHSINAAGFARDSAVRWQRPDNVGGHDLSQQIPIPGAQP